MKYIDLHIHTRASDGTDTPAQVVSAAAELGLAAIAVTDHDTTDGIAEAVEAGREKGIEILTGAEFSADYPGREIHILGYCFDPNADSIQQLCARSLQERNRRNEKLLAAVSELGIAKEELEELKAEHPVLGRPHIAGLLVRHGFAADIQDAFARFLGPEGSLYIERRRMPYADVIAAVRQGGGLPVLAHPMSYGFSRDQVLQMVSDCVKAGIQGLECLYAANTPEDTAYISGLASRFGLLVTGGSDYHGLNKKHARLGTPGDVPYELAEQLRRAAQA